MFLAALPRRKILAALEGTLRPAHAGAFLQAANHKEQRLTELRLEYAARFRHICHDMDAAAFAELVEEMTRFRQKYEELEEELSKRPVGDMTPER